VRWLWRMAADYSNRGAAVATRWPDTSVASGNSAKWNKQKIIYSFWPRRGGGYPAGSLGSCARPVIRHPAQGARPLIAESFQPLAVGLILIALFAAFVREWFKPDVAVMLAVAALLGLGLLAAGQVLRVFSNSAPATIACLLVISAALEKTGCVGRLAQGRERRLLLGLLAAGLLVSPFINNTPVVMVLMPAVISLAARYKVAPSRLLIPLSYATILGGLVTMVGTSTNILVDGVARDMGLAPFSMFEITAPALILAMIGCTFLYFAAPRFLPVRETLSQQFT